MSTRRHKLGTKWNEMNGTDKANWLANHKYGLGWSNESWWNLPEFIQAEFIDSIEIPAAIYAYR